MRVWLRTMLSGLVALMAVCLLLRTWVVMGLIVPMAVSGSSMAPGLRGSHFQSTCLSCGSNTDRSVESSVAAERLPCPACGEASSMITGPILPADRLWVSRLGRPQRWDAVVAESPDERGLCVKRLVGLPGEEVAFDGGDLLIDGRVVQKTLGEQRAVRVRVAEHPGFQNRVVFTPVGQPVFTDDLPYNAALTRRLNPVSDLMVSATVSHGDRLSASVAIGLVRFGLSDSGTAILSLDGVPVASVERRLPPHAFRLEASTFDSLAVLAIDGEVWLQSPLPRLGPIEHVEAVVSGEGSRLAETTLWRDLYYDYPVGVSPRGWLLGPGEVFVLGDNTPVSIDSRLWGPIRRNSIVGRPLSGW
ncbi:MAG: S26 family signal peptidase [Planctomycetota bacterium]